LRIWHSPQICINLVKLYFLRIKLPLVYFKRKLPDYTVTGLNTDYGIPGKGCGRKSQNCRFYAVFPGQAKKSRFCQAPAPAVKKQRLEVLPFNVSPA
jgi:hypothetical protein